MKKAVLRYTRVMSYANPPDPKAYAARVYGVVRAIPAGRVMTYGQIAALIPPIGEPEAYIKLSPRWVGAAMAQCPDDVPWQRVINRQGKVSPRPGYGPLAQKSLLEQEGVVFDAKERVDLQRHGWAPDNDWRRANSYVLAEELPKQEGLF
jgi:methylated-DNA-protein-cysteine methyltransferase-like protein